MQPTYLPWSGYFAMMQTVEVFVFLDNVQFARRSWQQRNRIKTKEGPIWLTVPVNSSGMRDQLISDVVIDNSSDFVRKHRRAIDLNYSRAEYFQAFGSDLLEDTESHKSLSELNIALIRRMAEKLKINVAFLRSSSLQATGTKADLLASICEELDANVYVSPPGSYTYLSESNAFKARNIPIQYFEYREIQYKQQYQLFLPQLSVVDVLLNCGPEASEIIARGIGASE